MIKTVLGPKHQLGLVEERGSVYLYIFGIEFEIKMIVKKPITVYSLNKIG